MCRKQTAGALQVRYFFADFITKRSNVALLSRITGLLCLIQEPRSVDHQFPTHWGPPEECAKLNDFDYIFTL